MRLVHDLARQAAMHNFMSAESMRDRSVRGTRVDPETSLHGQLHLAGVVNRYVSRKMSCCRESSFCKKRSLLSLHARSLVPLLVIHG